MDIMSFLADHVQEISIGAGFILAVVAAWLTAAHTTRGARRNRAASLAELQFKHLMTRIAPPAEAQVRLLAALQSYHFKWIEHAEGKSRNPPELDSDTVDYLKLLDQQVGSAEAGADHRRDEGEEQSVP